VRGNSNVERKVIRIDKMMG